MNALDYEVSALLRLPFFFYYYYLLDCHPPPSPVQETLLEIHFFNLRHSEVTFTFSLCADGRKEMLQTAAGGARKLVESIQVEFDLAQQIKLLPETWNHKREKNPVLDIIPL